MPETRNGPPTEEGKKILAEARKTLGDAAKSLTDQAILRIITFQKFDENKSIEAIKDHLKFRKIWKMDDTKDLEKMEVFSRFGQHYYGKAKHDEAYVIDRIGGLDAQGMINAASARNFVRHGLNLFERLCKEGDKYSSEAGKAFGMGLVVYDLEGLTADLYTTKQLLNTFLTVVTLAQQQYEGCTLGVLVIRGPSLINLAYAAVKPVLSESLIKSIEIVGEDWKEKMLERIDAACLPVMYGGTMPDPAELTNRIPPPLPEKYYLKKPAGFENLDKTTVAAGEKQTFDFIVTKTPSKLRWCYGTTYDDVGFEVTFKDSPDAEPAVVVPYIRLETSILPDESDVVCDKTGTYTVTLDNSYSWMSSKEVFHKFSIE